MTFKVLIDVLGRINTTKDTDIKKMILHNNIFFIFSLKLIANINQIYI